VQFHLVQNSPVLILGNESVPIQLAQCRFAGLAISSAEIYFKNIFEVKYTEAILSDSYG